MLALQFLDVLQETYFYFIGFFSFCFTTDLTEDIEEALIDTSDKICYPFKITYQIQILSGWKGQIKTIFLHKRPHNSQL